jgi:alpha-tubulin suppressor-like RCC1 family protein
VFPGTGHDCALASNGTPRCWGSNSRGQLGIDVSQFLSSLTPVEPQGGRLYTALTAGSINTCGLAGTGDGFCWGSNEYGQLGNGATTPNATANSVPQAVQSPVRFKQIAAASRHACGLGTNGELYCWGRNDLGQLGSTTGSACAGGLTCQPIPTLVPGITFSSVSASGLLTCGLSTTGAAYCWGSNSVGQLGAGIPADNSPHAAPVAVAGGLTFVKLSSHQNNACGLTSDGSVYCWGMNSVGDLGISASASPNQCAALPGAPIPCAISPVRVATSLSFKSISKGFQHTCAMSTADVLYCWGYNFYGELVNGTTTLTSTPTPVTLPSATR